MELFKTAEIDETAGKKNRATTSTRRHSASKCQLSGEKQKPAGIDAVYQHHPRRALIAVNEKLE